MKLAAIISTMEENFLAMDAARSIGEVSVWNFSEAVCRRVPHLSMKMADVFSILPEYGSRTSMAAKGRTLNRA